MWLMLLFLSWWCPELVLQNMKLSQWSHLIQKDSCVKCCSNYYMHCWVSDRRVCSVPDLWPAKCKQIIFKSKWTLEANMKKSCSGVLKHKDWTDGRTDGRTDDLKTRRLRLPLWERVHPVHKHEATVTLGLMHHVWWSSLMPHTAVCNICIYLCSMKCIKCL